MCVGWLGGWGLDDGGDGCVGVQANWPLHKTCAFYHCIQSMGSLPGAVIANVAIR